MKSRLAGSDQGREVYKKVMMHGIWRTFPCLSVEGYIAVLPNRF